MSAKKENKPAETGFTSTRIEAFSDGVIAIIITLMILEIKIPETHAQDNHGFWGTLHHLVPHVLAYAVSFIMLGIYWVNHHNFFQRIKYGDRKLLWLNLNLLFWMSLIPIPTNIIGDDPMRPASSLIYAIVMFMTSASFTYMGIYANKVGLFTEMVPPSVKAKNMRRNLTSLGLYAISMITAFISVYISFAIFLYIAAIFFMPKLGISGIIGEGKSVEPAPPGPAVKPVEAKPEKKEVKNVFL